MNYISIPIITLFVYLIIEFLKSIIKTEFFKAFIPILSSLLGAGIAVLMFYVVPNLMPSNDILGAIILGIFNGLSATGSNQIIKQIKKYKVYKIEKLSK